MDLFFKTWQILGYNSIEYIVLAYGFFFCCFYPWIQIWSLEYNFFFFRNFSFVFVFLYVHFIPYPSSPTLILLFTFVCCSVFYCDFIWWFVLSFLQLLCYSFSSSWFPSWIFASYFYIFPFTDYFKYSGNLFSCLGHGLIYLLVYLSL